MLVAKLYVDSFVTQGDCGPPVPTLPHRFPAGRLTGGAYFLLYRRSSLAGETTSISWIIGDSLQHHLGKHNCINMFGFSSIFPIVSVNRKLEMLSLQGFSNTELDAKFMELTEIYQLEKWSYCVVISVCFLQLSLALSLECFIMSQLCASPHGM